MRGEQVIARCRHGRLFIRIFARIASAAVFPLFVASTLFAQSVSSPTAVFIDSDPIGAVVIVDNKTILSRTPVLIHGLSVGKHRIDIARRGYAPRSTTFEVTDKKPTVVKATLRREFIDPIFAAGRKVLINGKQADYSKYHYRLPIGEYRIGEMNGIATVTPVFPARQILTVIDITTGGLLVTSAILAGEAILNTAATSPQDNTGNNNTANMGQDIFVWIMTGIATLSDAFLHIQKTRYLRTYAATPVPIRTSSTNAERLYRRAQTLLGSGNLSVAAELYIRIIRDNSDSPYYPRALYQLAKIHAIQGDNLLATAELRIILDKYPAPDLYDKTCKSLADISYRQGEYMLALGYLNKMVFLDPLFPRAQVEKYRRTIEEKMNGVGP